MTYIAQFSTYKKFQVFQNRPQYRRVCQFLLNASYRAAHATAAMNSPHPMSIIGTTMSITARARLGFMTNINNAAAMARNTRLALTAAPVFMRATPNVCRLSDSLLVIRSFLDL